MRPAARPRTPRRFIDALQPSQRRTLPYHRHITTTGPVAESFKTPACKQEGRESCPVNVASTRRIAPGKTAWRTDALFHLERTAFVTNRRAMGRFSGFSVGGFYLGETFANTGGIHRARLRRRVVDLAPWRFA